MAAQRLLLALVLIALAVVIYRFFTEEGFKSSAGTGAGTTYAAAPIIITAPPAPEQVQAAAGPAPPTQAGTESNRAPAAIVQAQDPYAETVDSADAPERITHPEHYYGPGISPELSSIGVEAGVASMRIEPGPHNATIFTPDQVANGGTYYDEVLPLEPTSRGISYSVLA
jgi:hypothetical protein